MLRGYLKENPNIPTGNAPGEIALQCTLSSDSPEAYCISVRPGLLIIDGASPAGVFYGIQTIRKAAYTAPKGESPRTSVRYNSRRAPLFLPWRHARCSATPVY